MRSECARCGLSIDVLYDERSREARNDAEAVVATFAGLHRATCGASVSKLDVAGERDP